MSDEDEKPLAGDPAPVTINIAIRVTFGLIVIVLLSLLALEIMRH